MLVYPQYKLWGEINSTCQGCVKKKIYIYILRLRLELEKHEKRSDPLEGPRRRLFRSQGNEEEPVDQTGRGYNRERTDSESK